MGRECLPPKELFSWPRSSPFSAALLELSLLEYNTVIGVENMASDMRKRAKTQNNPPAYALLVFGLPNVSNSI